MGGGEKKSYSGYEIFISQRVPSPLIKAQHLHILSVCEERGVCSGGEGNRIRGKPIPPGSCLTSPWVSLASGARTPLRVQVGCWQPVMVGLALGMPMGCWGPWCWC